MAIIEVVFPHFKEGVKLDDLETKPFPYLLEQLRAVGILGLRHGTITTDNGVDVSENNRGILLVEYPKASAFYTFLESPEFALFKEKVKDSITAPPTLKLFETSIGLESVGDNPALELILASPRTGNDLAGLLDRVKSLAKPALSSHAIFGVNLKSEDNEIVVIESFKDQKELERGQNRPAHQVFLSQLREMANITHLLGNIAKVDV